jgi:hypothetical protein
MMKPEAGYIGAYLHRHAQDAGWVDRLRKESEHDVLLGGSPRIYAGEGALQRSGKKLHLDLAL